MTASPPGTASAPPGQKSFCTSTTIRASRLVSSIQRLSPAPSTRTWCYNGRHHAMHLRKRIPTAILLFCCSALIAQNTKPAQNSAPKTAAPKPVQSPASPAQPPAPEYTDPCAAHAMTVDFDTCYADQF